VFCQSTIFLPVLTNEKNVLLIRVRSPESELPA
jgi:hypothetical protein